MKYIACLFASFVLAILELTVGNETAKCVVQLLGLVFIIPSMWSLIKIADALKYANNFEPTNRPATLFVNKKTNTWQTGYVSDRYIWWRSFFYSLRGYRV